MNTKTFVRLAEFIRFNRRSFGVLSTSATVVFIILTMLVDESHSRGGGGVRSSPSYHAPAAPHMPEAPRMPETSYPSGDGNTTTTLKDIRTLPEREAFIKELQLKGQAKTNVLREGKMEGRERISSKLYRELLPRSGSHDTVENSILPKSIYTTLNGS